MPRLRDSRCSSLTNRGDHGAIRGLRLAAFASAEHLAGDFERTSIKKRSGHGDIRARGGLAVLRGESLRTRLRLRARIERARRSSRDIADRRCCRSDARRTGAGGRVRWRSSWRHPRRLWRDDSLHARRRLPHRRSRRCTAHFGIHAAHGLGRTHRSWRRWRSGSSGHRGRSSPLHSGRHRTLRWSGDRGEARSRGRARTRHAWRHRALWGPQARHAWVRRTRPHDTGRHWPLRSRTARSLRRTRSHPRRHRPGHRGNSRTRRRPCPRHPRRHGPRRRPSVHHPKRCGARSPHRPRSRHGPRHRRRPAHSLRGSRHHSRWQPLTSRSRSPRNRRPALNGRHAAARRRPGPHHSRGPTRSTGDRSTSRRPGRDSPLHRGHSTARGRTRTRRPRRPHGARSTRHPWMHRARNRGHARARRRSRSAHPRRNRSLRTGHDGNTHPRWPSTREPRRDSPWATRRAGVRRRPCTWRGGGSPPR